MKKRDVIIDIAVDIALNNQSVVETFFYKYSEIEIINSRYFLSYAILSSGVKNQHAVFVSQEIADCYNERKYTELSCYNVKKILLNKEKRGWCYRFPNIRAQWVHDSLSVLQSFNNKIPLCESDCYINNRDKVVRLFRGVGLKQASLMMRNLANCYDCCVVDTHIINFLIMVGMLPQYYRKVSIDRKKYFLIESVFRMLSKKVNIPAALFDVAVWKMLSSNLDLIYE